VEGMAKYQRHLKRLGPGTVMLHYVVLPDKVRMILSTHNNQIGYASAIDEKTLNLKIQEFRDALQYAREDPRPAGNELYKTLIAPIARDLHQLQARTLILSLDGVLRYVPFAALYDGSRYLVQDYQLAQVTEAADIRLTAETGRPGSFAGLGLTQQVPGFDPLPAVKAELEGILQSGRVKGDIYLDKAFTAERVRQTLRQDVSLLHIASHFVFRPGTEADSYLLLGDGGKLSLRDLRIADYDFQDVELLTLSACDTASGGGADANGREVEGLGVLAQQKGARAVMATLWPVADASTGMLMQNFYRLRAEHSGTTKADALRQAQLVLLTGQHVKAAVAPGSGAEQRGAGRAGRAPRFTPDPNAPYAHPYFWAPFILMGNWL
jgi:CHAT domain-containing protein